MNSSLQKIHVRNSTAAVSCTEDGKRPRAAGEAGTVVRTPTNSIVKATEVRILAAKNVYANHKRRLDPKPGNGSALVYSENEALIYLTS